MPVLFIGLLAVGAIYVYERGRGTSLFGASPTLITAPAQQVQLPPPPPLPLPNIRSLNTVSGPNAGQVAGSAVGTVAPLTGPAAPFVAAGAGLLSIFSKIFAGCGQSCIDASKVNQVFYAAMANLDALLGWGFIGCNTAAAVVQYWIGQAQGDFAQDAHGVAGWNLTQQTMQNKIAFYRAHPRGPGSGCQGGNPFPSDPSPYYVGGAQYPGLVGFPWAPAQKANFPLPPPAGSWYSDSLSQAAQLTTATLNNVGIYAGVVDTGD